jgi:hypothetical protein
MKQESNSFPSKVSYTTKDLNSEEEEISNIEFQKIAVKVTNDLKERHIS